MQVNNLKGTSDNQCNCKSWLDHWGNYSGGTYTPFTLCSVIGCGSAAEVGAHVHVENSGLAGLLARAMAGLLNCIQY